VPEALEKLTVATPQILLSDIGLPGEDGLSLIRKVRELPVGIAKLGDLGRALASRPKLLLLDEPAVGLNDSERARMVELLISLNRVERLSMLIVDHNVSFVTALCQEITVLASGGVISHGSPAVIRSDPAVIQAYLGDEAHASA